MFYRQERVEDVQQVDTKVRVGTEVELYNSARKYETPWRLLSNANDAIVLQDMDYALNVFALDGNLNPMSNEGLAVTHIKATINKETQDLFFADELLVYSKRVVTNPLKNVPLRRGDTIEVERTIPAQHSSNLPSIDEWYNAEIIDVTSRQLLIKVLLNGQDEPEYISFWQADSATHDGDVFEISSMHYNQEVKV